MDLVRQNPDIVPDSLRGRQRAQPLRTIEVGWIPIRAMRNVRAVATELRAAGWAERDQRAVIGVGDLFDRALDEEAAIVIASGAAEDDEIAIAMNVVGDAQTRLELFRISGTVAAVGNIVLGVDARACQPG